MIYSVVPRELADELYPKLVQHYSKNADVTVIVDRRSEDRRSRGGRQLAGADQRRVRRDRRRSRMPGDMLRLAEP